VIQYYPMVLLAVAAAAAAVVVVVVVEVAVGVVNEPVIAVVLGNSIGMSFV